MRYLVNAIALLGIGALGLPVFGAIQARPGTVNYVEGAVALDGRVLGSHSVGSTEMAAGQVLSTGDGKAEVLLTPGVFLRLDSQSAVRMLNPSLTPTKVELVRGRASFEVDELYKQSVLQVKDAGVTTQLIRTGYYEFDAIQPQVRVFHGRAEVNTGGGKWRTVKDHHALALEAGPKAKPVDFDASGEGDELYSWSSVRSQYLAEANNQIAGEYAGVAGFYPGWYWDPYMMGYTFIGGDPFWSPFGFGFYPPWGWYGGVWGGGWYGNGWYGAPGYWGGRRFGPVGPAPRIGGGAGFRGGVGASGGGFHGGGGFSGGGGFHGGGGGGIHR